MLGAERQELLMAQLKSAGSLTISDSAKRFNVSEETIRRDLNIIGQAIPLRRVYGGAYIKRSAESDAPLSLRQNLFKEEKERIALECVKHIENNNTIMIDSSDTASYIARYLPGLHYSLAVITNSLAVMQLLCEAEDISVFCIGGAFRHKAKSYVGSHALDALNSHVADKAFVSPSGVNMKFGLTDHNPDECHVRRTMLERSHRHFLLADHTKLDGEPKGANSVCPLADIDCVITDRELSPEWEETFARSRVEVRIV